MLALKFLYVLDFIVPFVMILVGLYFKSHTYTKIGSNGYSTPNSKQSQETWDYAQLIAPSIFISIGKTLLIILSVLTGIFLVRNVDIENAVRISLIVGGIGMFISFGMIEHKISLLNTK